MPDIPSHARDDQGNPIHGDDRPDAERHSIRMKLTHREFHPVWQIDPIAELHGLSIELWRREGLPVIVTVDSNGESEIYWPVNEDANGGDRTWERIDVAIERYWNDRPAPFYSKSVEIQLPTNQESSND